MFCFLQCPLQFTKKLFEEKKIGKLEISQEELEDCLKRKYHDSKKNEPMEETPGLQCPHPHEFHLTLQNPT